MFKNITALKEVIDPNLEPGVISHEMIQEAYLNLYNGEQRRLKELEPIEYDKFKILRLEFKNILRIDHLWILPNLTKLSLSYNKLEKIENLETLVNLKELNLSFNYIERIENLDNLIKLETLSLFNNLITKIENLNLLESLEILSLGNNQIDSFDGLERIRFFKNLKILNFEGNPIAHDDKKPLREYLTAILPRLQYYNYIFITEKERAHALDKYRHKVELIETNESDELLLLAKKEKEITEGIRLSLSFVEFLNEHQLFDSFWEGNEDGAVLRLIGDKAEELIATYKEDIFKITQHIYKIGLDKYKERKQEVETFEKCLTEGQLASQQKSIATVEKCLEESEEYFFEARVLFTKVEKYHQQGLDESSDEIAACLEQLDELYNNFKDKIDVLWEVLMEQEVNLFEAVEEILSTFERNIMESLQEFLDLVLPLFLTLHDICRNFGEVFADAVNTYIQYHSDLGGNFQIVPEPLHKCIKNKDNVIDLLDGMKNWHLQRLDDREERLTSRSKNWVKTLIEKKKDAELKRNRNKLTEINYFIGQMRDTFMNIQAEVQEDLANG